MDLKSADALTALRDESEAPLGPVHHVPLPQFLYKRPRF